MNITRKILFYTLSILLGLVFLASGIGKLMGLSQFTLTISDFGIYQIATAEVFARLLVGLEIVLGIFLLFQIRLRMLTLPLVATSLIFFSVYLFYQFQREGAEADCGCFGELVEMGTVAALIKNGIMLLAAIGLFLVAPGWKKTVKKSKSIQYLVFAAVAAALLASVWTKADYKIEPLYKAKETEHPALNLRKGKHILAFFSATCSHCREAAKLLVAIHDSDATLPIYVVVWGKNDVMKEDFFQDTKADGLPHLWFTNRDAFIKLAGPYVPTILWLNNGHIDKRIYYKEIRMKDLQAWQKN